METPTKKPMDAATLMQALQQLTPTFDIPGHIRKKEEGKRKGKDGKETDEKWYRIEVACNGESFQYYCEDYEQYTSAKINTLYQLKGRLTHNYKNDLELALTSLELIK